MSPLQKPEPTRVPAVAALLTWFVPGAGHVYLGRTGFALAAFAVVEGIFFLGVTLSDGMLFEYLQPDLRTPLAPMLSPETGNLGALLWMRREHPYLAPGSPQPWPSTMRLGAIATAVSGILNLCLIVAAHRAALESGPRTSRAAAPSGNRPGLAVLAGWLVPGLGHWISGRKLRGAVVFVLLVGLFALGTALAEGSNLDRERHFFYWGGQVFLGLPAILAELAFGAVRVRSDIAYADAGLVFGCVAGLLNALAMTDAYGMGEAAGREESDTRTAAPAEGNA